MSKFVKFKFGATAGVCAMLFAATTANAEVYSLSQETIRNFTIGVFDGALTSTPPVANTTINGYSYVLTNKATVNGITSNSTQTCNQTTCVNGTPVLDPLATNVGLVTKGENDFTAQGQAPAGATYSRADSVIATDQLTSGGLNFTSESQIAESLLNIGGNANANSTLLSSASLSVIFTVNTASNLNNLLVLSFNADLLRALGIASPTGNPLVSSAVNSTFSLTDVGQNQVSWNPDGVAGSGCNVDGTFAGGGVVCSNEMDPFSLNRTISSSLNPTTFSSSQTGLFGITLSGLRNGTYTFDLSTKVQTQVQQEIPEPGSVALVGLALAGLGLVTRRRQAKI